MDEWSEYAATLASHQAVGQGRLLLVAREPLHLEVRVRLELVDGKSWGEPIGRLLDASAASRLGTERYRL